jgi:hypothetical protein
MAKKALIFTEFTKERDSCKEMIDILEKCGQSEAAELLTEYNSSPPFMPDSNEIELKVIPATVLKMENSKILNMSKRPRGKCVIINNVTKILSKESLRFKNIFEQLFFDVILHENLSASQMETELKNISKIAKDSLIVMIISHGHDEKVIGFDGNDLSIADIVDIFSEKNCSGLKRKPKLFFFNCCRISESFLFIKNFSEFFLITKHKIIFI